IDVAQAALSYDRKFLATNGVETKLEGNTFSQRQLFGLRDAATGKMLVEFQGGCQAMGFSPDGKILAIVSGDRTLHLREAVTGREIYKVANWPAGTIAFAPDGKRLAGGSGQNKVLFLELPPD